MRCSWTQSGHNYKICVLSSFVARWQCLGSGPWFNIEMPSYRYRKSHCGEKILRPSYLHNGISYTGKTTSLYWIRALESWSPLIQVLAPNMLTPCQLYPDKQASTKFGSKYDFLFSFKKMHFKMLSAEWWPFMLNHRWWWLGFDKTTSHCLNQWWHISRHQTWAGLM